MPIERKMAMPSGENMYRVFCIGMFVAFVALLVWIITVVINEEPVVYGPQQSEQVEVVGKRYVSDGSIDGSIDYYIVAFKFSDNSVKEFEVGSGGFLALNNPRGVYDSVKEGDTGTLTYREIENIEEKYKKEELHYAGREFIGFEKDPVLDE